MTQSVACEWPSLPTEAYGSWADSRKDAYFGKIVGKVDPEGKPLYDEKVSDSRGYRHAPPRPAHLLRAPRKVTNRLPAEVRLCRPHELRLPLRDPPKGNRPKDYLARRLYSLRTVGCVKCGETWGPLV